jgi:hypothetical protein
LGGFQLAFARRPAVETPPPSREDQERELGRLIDPGIEVCETGAQCKLARLNLIDCLTLKPRPLGRGFCCRQ